MSNFDGVLNPVAGWPDIPQASTSMVVLGGAGGPLNEQATQLTARTKKLKEDIENIPLVGFGGQYKNLVVRCTGAGYQGTVTADRLVVEDSSYNCAVLRGVSLSFNGANSGANGLDTGSVSLNTWYYLYVIYNGTTTASLLSLSSTSPTLPSGYTKFARVGAAYALTTAFKPSTKTGKLVHFGIDDNFDYVPLLANVSSSTRTPVSTLPSAPPTAVALAVGAIMAYGGAGSSSIYYNSSASDSIIYINGAGQSYRVVTNVYNNTLYYVTSSSSGANLYLTVYSYEDSV